MGSLPLPSLPSLPPSLIPVASLPDNQAFGFPAEAGELSCNPVAKTSTTGHGCVRLEVVHDYGTLHLDACVQAIGVRFGLVWLH